MSIFARYPCPARNSRASRWFSLLLALIPSSEIQTPSAASYSIIVPFSQKNPDAPADDPRFWCAACCNGFDPAVDGGDSEQCPKGHRTGDFEALE